MAKIFCFSSTGNSLYVSKRLAENIGAKVVSMSKSPMSCDDDIIGFVFPVYFWGLPKIVESYIKDLQIINKNPYIFAIITYGGKVYGVQGTVNKLLQHKGLSLHYAMNIKCVENYIPGFKVNNVKNLHLRTDKKVDLAIEDINKKIHSKIEKNSFINNIIYKQYPGLKGSCDKHFTVSSKCTSCGVCQKICPVNNISIEEGTPTFLHNCEHCLACIHACPTHAIEWKQSTQDKDRYRHPKIKLNELIEFCGNKL